jgi:ERCC4-type nuclease
MPPANKRKKLESTDYTIIVDTREQRPFDFAGIRSRSGRLIVPRIKDGTLKTGDYSIAGFEDRITIERKSLSDLFGVVGSQRDRFIRELVRLSTYEFAAIVTEGSYDSILYSPPTHSKLNPTAVINSLLSWQVQYGVHVLPMPTRREAELATFFTLRTFYRKATEATQSPTE